MFTTLDTPSVLVDLDVAEANIRKFQAYCNAHGLALRPHIKTHKLPSLASYQIEQGAIGVTCQKVSEAEAMTADGSIGDVLITYNILGAAKTRRLRALADRVRLSVVADNSETVEGLSEAFADALENLPVLVECNTGADRCGVSTPQDVLTLAREIAASPGLEFAGLMTYPPSGKANAVAEWLQRAVDLLESHGIAVGMISSGGSPDMWQAHEMPLATEYRIGTYVYNDRSLVGRGTCGWEDCALSVLATVVSVPADDRAVIDAGSKVLTSDLLGLEGYGHVMGRDDLLIDQLSEEHGRIVCDGPIGLSVGDRLRIVPNHACVVSNMLDHIELVRGETPQGQAAVEARGQVW
ncbi:D-TA family PLP-dependent enzyme [Phaeobacter gallaeciensis]|uniref:Amino acid aldolase or racemase n=1 Tax=Phaeobacter gallaeciensis TaxID=60890 RepID=A0AAD0EEW5_9RHOB|nr:D-TA family PLP-dependent enzyme [Phaeobacter gallaeciensis]AHD11852.1 putative amino acid aldolase or racemase [Phaeobacter gallaeciensis DSM 26640]ATE95115.1 putative amino acid aldolase or racemase [Phaeobacter gallaeciensis]ATE99423.1 putative amino acid aldolase or racemase [Phaeobacter gallaeciensis]ATF03820.1 putative amino acid aldolase or racemase [Phaeobacter gallaeciensis]ATF08013.1 putative amino acid aldolase or racemase [Phaeobacter gallaeciensis]